MGKLEVYKDYSIPPDLEVRLEDTRADYVRQVEDDPRDDPYQRALAEAMVDTLDSDHEFKSMLADRVLRYRPHMGSGAGSGRFSFSIRSVPVYS